MKLTKLIENYNNATLLDILNNHPKFKDFLNKYQIDKIALSSFSGDDLQITCVALLIIEHEGDYDTLNTADLSKLKTILYRYKATHSIITDAVLADFDNLFSKLVENAGNTIDLIWQNDFENKLSEFIQDGVYREYFNSLENLEYLRDSGSIHKRIVSFFHHQLAHPKFQGKINIVKTQTLNGITSNPIEIKRGTYDIIDDYIFYIKHGDKNIALVDLFMSILRDGKNIITLVDDIEEYRKTKIIFEIHPK